MRHLRLTVLAALAVALYAAPVAAAHHPAVTPAEGKLLGEVSRPTIALPVSQIPWRATAIRAWSSGARWSLRLNALCTVQRGTAIILGFAPSWSNAEDPFPATAPAQRAVIRDFEPRVHGDLRRRRRRRRPRHPSPAV